MKTVAFHTLGCKVNQYDSQAMLEQFIAAGYTPVDFDTQADVYVINTCVVTQVGENKSLQAVRRALRQSPQANVVVAGCLAQKDARLLLEAGVRLALGSQYRARVVELLQQAQQQGTQLAAVDALTQTPYEPLEVAFNEGHTRATMKIQEGCDRYCSYCIIPSVRGPIRSRPLAAISAEAQRLAQAGYQEIVLAGIHLASYGREWDGSITLLDAVRAAAQPQGIRRIRLGSLEPVIVTKEFAQALRQTGKVCPQFHLSLQSGSDAVLQRMRRRYSAAEFLHSLDILRRVFPGCAITTDVIAGFPGETQQEHEQTMALCRQAGFAKMHVFPYSARKGTAAAAMPGQLPRAVKTQRAAQLSALGGEVAANFRRTLLGTVQEVLFEQEGPPGSACGYTPQYMQVCAPGAHSGQILPVRITAMHDDGFDGILYPSQAFQPE